jgi:hypothetical protein
MSGELQSYISAPHQRQQAVVVKLAGTTDWSPEIPTLAAILMMIGQAPADAFAVIARSDGDRQSLEKCL